MYTLSTASDIVHEKYNEDTFGIYVFKDGIQSPVVCTDTIDCSDDRIIVLICCEGHTDTNPGTLGGYIAATVALRTIIESLGGMVKEKTLHVALREKWVKLSSELFHLAHSNVLKALEQSHTSSDRTTRSTSGFLEVSIGDPTGDHWTDVGGGTTCTLFIIAEGTLYSANVGHSSSFCLDVQEGRVIELTGDHRPTSISEYERITALNPHIHFIYDGTGLDIHGNDLRTPDPVQPWGTRIVTRGGASTLSTTRSLGDSLMHSAGVTWAPTTCTCKLSRTMRVVLSTCNYTPQQLRAMVQFGYGAKQIVEASRTGENMVALTCYYFN